MNKNFCYNPWISIDINPQGKFKPCCKYKNELGSTIDEYLNSQELNNIKQEFLNGGTPSGCERCWRDEAAGIMSKRQIDYKYVLKEKDPGLDNILIATISFGNTCNLACRICDSYSSSRWLPEERKNLEYKNSKGTIFQHQQFYKDKNFMLPLYEITKSAIHFHFPGGEPMLTSVEHVEFIKNIKNKNVKSLHYTTNITVFPDDQLWELWDQFENVDIQLSVDGIEDIFEYNRWPASWDTCYSNIKKYQEQQKKSKNLQISISHSISIFTIWDLENFLDWCKKEKLPIPYLGIVSNPKYYSIMNLPYETKLEIQKRLTSKETLPIVNAMLAEQFNDFEITKKYVKLLDKSRNQNFDLVYKKFNQLLRI